MHISNSMQFNDEKLIHVNVEQFVIFVDGIFLLLRLNGIIYAHGFLDPFFWHFIFLSNENIHIFRVFQDAKRCC